MLDLEGIEHKDCMDRPDYQYKEDIDMSRSENSILEDIDMDIVADKYMSSSLNSKTD